MKKSSSDTDRTQLVHVLEGEKRSKGSRRQKNVF